MGTQYVSGASPISFISENVDGSVGKQYQIPLGSLAVSNGQPDPTSWLQAAGIAPGGTDYTLVVNLVASLAAQGVLTIQGA